MVGGQVNPVISVIIDNNNNDNNNDNNNNNNNKTKLYSQIYKIDYLQIQEYEILKYIPYVHSSCTKENCRKMTI